MTPMSPEQDVKHVIARYVRAVDHRDAEAMAALFLPDGKVVISQRYTGMPDESPGSHPIGELDGAVAIGAAVTGMMPPHPAFGWSHHVASNPIIEIDGDRAKIDTQFMMLEIRGAARPLGGWPEDTFGAQGTIKPREAGYYRTLLHRMDGTWRIARHDILHDLPFAIPAA
jgi:hypothetical protein